MKRKPETPAEPMQIESWPIDRPVPYEANARKLSARAIDVVASSLREFGWRQPIVVDAEGVIIAGHTRLLAAKKLGLQNVPVHVAAGLSPDKVRAYRLMDNRSNDETDWNQSLLAAEMVALNELEFDLSLTGFDAGEIAEFLRAASIAAGNTDEDDVPEPPADPVAVMGDLWLLGDHRLLCGDSTSVESTQALLGGEKADPVFTDPPYNVDYDPEARPNGPTSDERKARPLGKIKNDKKSPEAFRAFLDQVYRSIDFAVKPGRAIYICHADTEGHHFRNAFVAQPWKMQSCLIWKKTSLVFGRADYHWMHEPILYGWKEGTERAHYEWMHEPILYGWKEGEAHVWTGDRKQTTIIEIATDHIDRAASDTGGKYVHPTQKPVALIDRALTNSTKAGEIVVDLFGGSGSTLIACEKAGRRARLMELDPKYIDVIIARWEQFTGRVATLEDGRTFEEVRAARLQQ
jgi:DNA modification methylase